MARHLVNFGLLASFLTLAVSGALAFFRPFSIVTTRVHVVFGLVTFVFVGLHLASRTGYFKRQLTHNSSATASRPLLIGVLVAWLLLLGVAFLGWTPARFLLGQSYEARHRAEIVRASPLTGFIESARHTRLVARAPTDDADVGVSLSMGFPKALKTLPSVAIWAETTAGTMIETLYIDPDLAYSDRPEWGGKPTSRHLILPLWRHRYTMVSGIDPTGEVDAISGATKSHSFSLDDYLVLGEEKSFVLCVEVNAHGDFNESYPDLHIGQPSLLYTALIELDSDQRHALLELTGHGGGAEKSGAIHYELDGFTSAKELVDLVLARTGPVGDDNK